MKANNVKGALAERLVQKYLRSKGFEILDTNVHLGKYSELDIVTRKDSIIHVIEVKALFGCGYLGDNLEFPVYNITPTKIRKLILGAHWYCQRENLLDHDLVIDAVGIIIDQDQAKSWIKYFPDITAGLV